MSLKKLILGCLFLLGFSFCLKIQKSQYNLSKAISNQKIQELVQINKIIEQKQRLLTTASSPFKFNNVIVRWLKNYQSRSAVCSYLCQSDSFFAFFQTQICYQSYNCTSLILQNVGVIILIISYLILPLIMILLGVWNFKCFSHYLAVMTGIVWLSSIYNKLSTSFQQSMETDYDLSSSQISSEIKDSQTQNSN